MEDGKRVMVFREELAERLHQARERAGLSQFEVAESLSLSRSAVSKMESAEQRVDSVVLSRMAGLYGVPVAELLGEGAKRQEEEQELPAEALLRSAGKISAGERAVLEEFLRICRNYAELRRKVGESVGR